MPAFITNAVQVQRFADALYNVAVGTTTMAQVTADITASGGLDNALNAYFTSSFGGVPTATIAANMCTNLGIVAGQNGLVAADVTTAQNYITGTLNAAPANARGAAVKGILNNLSALTSDKVFGAVATKFNSDIDKATAYTGVSDITAGTAPAPVLNTTFALTTGTNTFLGTAGDDTFDAGLSTGSLQTLNSGDALDGGAGNDSLQAVVTGSVTPASLKSIEAISLTGTTNTSTVDLTNANGLLTVVNQASTVALTIAGVSKAVSLTVQDTSTAGQVISYNDVTGSSDSATVSLKNVTGAATLTVAGVEALTLEAAGSTDNVLATLTTANTTRLNVTGSKGLNAGTLGTTVGTIDASANAGGVTAVLASTSAATVTGGSGNDSITFGSSGAADSINAGAGNDIIIFTANFTTADTINGGDGTDTLRATNANLVTASASTPSTYTVTNVETIQSTDVSAGGVSINAVNVSATATRLNLAHATATNVTGAGADSIVGGAGSFTVGLGSTVATTGTLGGSLTVTDTGTGITDSLTILNTEIASGTGLNANVYNANNLIIVGYETVTVNSGSVSASATSTLGTITVTGDVGGTLAETVNFSGSNNVTVGVITADIVNASALTASSGTVLTMVTNSTAQTVTGSSGIDILFGNTTLASSIDGGAGNDTITAGSGNDTVLGNDGNDTITTGGGAGDNINGGAGNDIVIATLTAGNTIVGGDGTDVLSLAVAGTAATASGVSGFETARLTAAFTQDMAVFLDNPTFTRVEVTNNVAAVYSNVGSLVTTAASNTTSSSLTATRLVDTTTNSINLIALGNATTTLFQVNDEETINLSSSSAVGAVTITTLTDTDLITLNVTGSNAITIGTLSANSTTTGTTLTINAAANTGGISVSAANSIIPASITGSATGSNALLTGTGGADTIVGGSAADTITGGLSADILTGGAGTDTFIFANTDTGTPSSTNFDTITDYGSASDVIDHATATIVITAGGTIGAGVAAISASGIATFNIADSTLALRLTAVAAAITETGAASAAGEVAAFQFGSDAYVFISDATNGLSATDTLIKLTGISLTNTAFDVVTIAGGNMTLA